MLQILPFLAGLATLTSFVLLVVSWLFGELERRHLVLYSSWFLIAGYCQFRPSSTGMAAAGLCLQTMLAIVLVVRRNLGA